MMLAPFNHIPVGAIFRVHGSSKDYWIKRSSRTACLYTDCGVRRAGPFYFRQGETFFYDPAQSIEV